MYYFITVTGYAFLHREWLMWILNLEGCEWTILLNNFGHKKNPANVGVFRRKVRELFLADQELHDVGIFRDKVIHRAGVETAVIDHIFTVNEHCRYAAQIDI
jgi:hypothetical protein